MGPASRLLLAFLLTTVPLAGCFGADEASTVRSVTATGGAGSLGWAYDGEGVMNLGATLEGEVDNAANEGRFVSAFSLGGRAWRIEFDAFAGGQDFQDGGVAFDLEEHGDTGVADASVPRLLARVAAWGTARVTVDGEPLPDPLTGEAAPWAAHLMLSDTTLRGADGRILKSDGATPYDPATPGDAQRVEGDPQAFLWVRAPSGADAHRPPVNATRTFAFNGPGATETMPVDYVGAGSGAVNFRARADPVGVGQFTLRVLDANGTVLGDAGGNVAPGQSPSGSIPLLDAQGPLTVEVTGRGSFTVEVDATVAFMDVPFLVLTWNDYVLTDGPAAADA